MPAPAERLPTRFGRGGAPAGSENGKSIFFRGPQAGEEETRFRGGEFCISAPATGGGPRPSSRQRRTARVCESSRPIVSIAALSSVSRFRPLALPSPPPPPSPSLLLPGKFFARVLARPTFPRQAKKRTAGDCSGRYRLTQR